MNKQKQKLKVTLTQSYHEDHVDDFYQTIPIDECNVYDGLKDEVDSWNSRDPVLIDAPTGSGKSTFVRKELIPRALQANKNVLILSNRIMISTQQKKMIMEDIQSPYRGRLTEEGLQDQEDFGNVWIMTYHKLQYFLNNEENKKWISNLRYVVMDEVHFFTSDCLFNEFCGGILNMIPRHFKNYIRIYMTATSSEVLYPLAEAEKKNYHDYNLMLYYQPERAIIRYVFPRNFESYKLQFFKDYKQLKELVKQFKNQKWMIFVDNKGEGKALLEEFKDEAEYLDADSKNTKTWKSIVNHEKFESRILITTPVLDCGANICDSDLKSMAVITDNKASLLQMIGRKRLDTNEKINIWVQDINKNTAKRRYDKYSKQLEWYNEFDACYNEASQWKLASKLWRSKDLRLRKMFGLEEGRPFENYLARITIKRRTEFYRGIYEGETTFREEVRRWLNKEVIASISALEKLQNFCEKYFNEELDEDKCNLLRSLIVNAYEEQGFKEAQPTRKDSLKAAALNNRLKMLDFPYRIQIIEKQWKIKKTK